MSPSMDNFVRCLSTNTLIPVLTNWIDIRDLICLDSSLTNSLDRPVFLLLISRENFMHVNNDFVLTATSLNWLCEKRLKVSKLNLKGFDNHEIKSQHISYIQDLKVIDNMMICGERLIEMDMHFIGSLRSLDIHSADLRDVHSCVSNILTASLTSLTIDKQSLTAEAVSCMPGWLPNLGTLRITGSGGKLKRNSVMKLVTFYKTQLVCFQVEHVDLLEDDFVVISQCLRLEELTLSAVDLTPTGLAAIMCRVRLKKLCIEGNDLIDDLAMCHVAPQCIELTYLDISAIGVTEGAVDALTNYCTKLTTFVMTDRRKYDDSTNIAILLRPFFKANPLLTDVNLRDSGELSSVSIALLLVYCPLLEKFSFNDGRNLTSSAWLKLLHNISLEELRIRCDTKYSYFTMHLSRLKSSHAWPSLDFEYTYDSSSITEEFVSVCLSSTPMLRILQLDDCSDLSDHFWVLLCEYCPHINSIILKIVEYDCFLLLAKHYRTQLIRFEVESSSIDDDTLSEGLSMCGENLTALNLFNNRDITYEAVDIIIKYCPKLVELNLGETCLNAEEFKRLCKHYRGLKRLYVRRCPGVTFSVINYLASKCSELLEVDFRGCLSGAKEIRDVVGIIRDNCPLIEKINHSFHY